MNGPLVKNLSGQLIVMKDKKIKVDSSHPFKMYSFKLNAKQLGYVYRKPSPTALNGASGENEIMIFYYYCCPALLYYMNTGTGTNVPIGPQAMFSLNYNIGYVDQN